MANKHSGIDKRLSQLGYRQDLRRRLHVWHVAGLAIAMMSPTVTVVLLGTTVFSVGGTFAIGANIIVNLIALPLALILAELGALYPLTGGIYSLARKILPGPLMWITAFNVLVVGFVILAVTCLGIAPFLKNLIPVIDLPKQVIAIIVLLIATAIALIKVELGAIINAILIIVECTALGTIVAAGLTHPHQSVTEILFHPTMLDGAQLTSVSTSVMLATLPAAFSMIAAPEIVLGFSEELIGDTRTLVRAVVVTTLLVIPVFLIPLTAAVVAAPNLAAFLSSPTPMIDSIEQAFGGGTATFINICISVALFTAMIGILMYFPRLLYAMGRDGMWGKELTGILSRLNRNHVPGAAVLVLAFISLLLIFVNALNWLVIFLGTCVTTMYLIVGLMGFWSRFNSREEVRPYRMPLWPILPIIAIIFTAFVLMNQDHEFLMGSLILDITAVLAWAFHRYFYKRSSNGVP